MYGGYTNCCYPTYTAPAYTAPVYGYAGGCNTGFGRGFALIVVLFILLIIVGAACIH